MLPNEQIIILKPADFFLSDALLAFESRLNYDLSDEDIYEVITSPYSARFTLSDWCVLITCCFLCSKEDFLLSITERLLSQGNSQEKLKYQSVINSFFNNYLLFLLAVYIYDDFERYSSFYQINFHKRSNNDLTAPFNHLPLFLKCKFIPNEILTSNILVIHKFLISNFTPLANQNPDSDELQSIFEHILLLMENSLDNYQSINAMVEVFSLCPVGCESIYISNIDVFLMLINACENPLNERIITNIFSDLLSNPRFSSVVFKENRIDLLPFCDLESDILSHPELFS